MIGKSGSVDIPVCATTQQQLECVSVLEPGHRILVESLVREGMWSLFQIAQQLKKQAR